MKIHHYVLWMTCILVHWKSQPFLKKPIQFNYATSCIKNHKQTNNKTQKDSPALKLVTPYL